MDEHFLEYAEAHQRALLDGAIEACRRAAASHHLAPVGVCHNCNEPVPDGAAFCAYTEPGETDAACLIDWRARHRRGVR